MALRTATLLAARMLSDDVRELTLDVGEPLAWAPGQWVSLRMPVGDAPLSRSYSIASPPRGDGRFELIVTRVPGGAGSGWLHAMQPGDTVEVADPTGFFTLPDPLAAPALFVATGTGLAPLRAMLLASLARGDAAPVTLLFGVRTAADLLYADELRALEAAHPRFRFCPTLSRADDAWTGRRGYVQGHVPELAAALGEGCEAWVCGLNDMVKAVRAVLKESLGFARQRIHTERYD